MLPFNEISKLTNGKWAGILAQCGIPRDYLTKKQGPCPMCGGNTRFRFHDRLGRGDWICNHCGHGDGFDLLKEVNGWDMKTAWREIKPIIGHIESVIEKPQSVEKIRASLNRTWNEGLPVIKGDAVDLYLTSRGVGLDQYPAALRCHRNLPYYDTDGHKMGVYPAMLARVLTEGKPASIHRTYLSNGAKAAVPSAKKIMKPVRTIKGGAVSLFQPIDTLAVTEGIETALAVYKKFNLPVWAAISEGGMQALIVPESVKEVLIFADNDASGVGQSAAQALARRMIEQGRRIEIHIPKTTGNDWLDEFTGKGKESVRG